MEFNERPIKEALKVKTQFILTVALLLSSACSALKASPAERSGYIPGVLKLEEDRARTPFHGNWIANADYFYERRSAADKILILPVRTDFLLEKGWWSNLNEADHESYQEDVRELAKYFERELKAAFERRENERWTLVDEADENTFIVEYALVEVIATKAHINAVGTALGFFVPGGGLITATASGSVAFEAKIYDGKDGELLAALADRESDKLSLVSVKDFEFYGHARGAIRDWSEQLAKFAYTDRDVKIEDSDPITINPF